MQQHESGLEIEEIEQSQLNGKHGVGIEGNPRRGHTAGDLDVEF